MGRGGKPLFYAWNVKTGVPKVKWNQVIYDRINEADKGQESTKSRKPLRLGTKRTLRRRVRAFRVRVSKLRIRIWISPLVWLQKLCDAYVRMIMNVEEQLGGHGRGAPSLFAPSIALGFHNAIFPVPVLTR